MKNSIYDYSDYKKYLTDALESQAKGARLKLASAAEVQPGYITHVLAGDAHFNLEQADRIANYLGHTEDQHHYFINLVSLNRAGTKRLQEFFKREIEKSRQSNQVLKTRLKADKMLSVEDQATFYSSWHYGAVHVSVSISDCDTELGISNYFNLPIKRVTEIVEFLERVGLILRESGKLQIGSTQVFVGTDSPLISKFHSNWRMQAIQSLDSYSEKDLHYSGVITASRADAAKIREIMVRTIEEVRAIVRESKDEACFNYSLDLFELGGHKI